MAAAMPAVDTVVFDIGNVLVRWDPRFLYRTLFADAERMEWFLAEVCNHDWNMEQDRGRTWDAAIAEAVGRHPGLEPEIRAFRDRWDVMIPGAIDGTVAILEALHAAGVALYAITNWSAETFPLARLRFGFLAKFRDIVVSGEERLVKPDPDIYRVLFLRAGVEPSRAVFIDDSPYNVAGAEAVGMHAIRFETPDQLARDLAAHGLPTTRS